MKAILGAGGEGMKPADADPFRAPLSGVAEYERRKQGWIEAHPEATPAEYTAAMRAIAEEAGV